LISFTLKDTEKKRNLRARERERSKKNKVTREIKEKC
jgi:hypothetical protein